MAMPDEHKRSVEDLPEFNDQQWDYLLRTDTLTVQIAKYTAMLQVLHLYYREISAALARNPSPELRALCMRTISRIREVTADAAQALTQMELEGPQPPA
jgi:hypothetical protein